MHIIKAIFRGICAFIFTLLVFVLPVVAAVVLTFNSPEKIEKSLNDSGVYSTFVDSALKELDKSNNNQSGDNNIPISNPAIKAAANKAFNPTLLQNSTESVLNGTYAWLKGSTPSPVFRIDLRAAKQTFAVAVGKAAKDRLASLPVCTSAQLQTIKSSDIDPFSVPCRPAGINLAAQQKKVTRDLATSKDFLGTPVITVQNLPKNDKGQTVFEQIKEAPRIYRLVNASPLLLAGLVLVTGAIVVLLNDSKRRGLKKLAIVLLSTGGFMLLVSIGTMKGLNKVTQPNGVLGKAVEGSFQQTAVKAANSIGRSMDQVLIYFSIAYILIGAGVLLVLHFTRPKDGKVDAKKDAPEPKPEPKTDPKTEDKKSEEKPVEKVVAK